MVYERHGILVIGMETFRNLIIDNLYPEVFAGRGIMYKLMARSLGTREKQVCPKGTG